MAKIGPIWGTNPSGHVKLMNDAFSALHKHAAKDGVTVTRDLAYGAHERQQLDMYVPKAAHTNAPCVVFVHGGAFTDGHRNRTDEIFANIGYYFARHGIVCANIGYRLAPDAKWPEAARDIGAALAWVKARAREYGIDPKRVFLMGHSAGGGHVASYAYDKRIHPKDGPGIAGVIVVSGRVRADNNAAENPNAKKVEAYYGEDNRIYDERSPVTQVSKDSVPTLVAWCEFENPLLDVYSAELVHRLGEAKRRGPQVVFLPHHNHTSTIAHVNTSDDVLGAAIRDFIADPR